MPFAAFIARICTLFSVIATWILMLFRRSSTRQPILPVTTADVLTLAPSQEPMVEVAPSRTSTLSRLTRSLRRVMLKDTPVAAQDLEAQLQQSAHADLPEKLSMPLSKSPPSPTLTKTPLSSSPPLTLPRARESKTLSLLPLTPTSIFAFGFDRLKRSSTLPAEAEDDEDDDDWDFRCRGLVHSAAPSLDSLSSVSSVGLLDSPYSDLALRLSEESATHAYSFTAGTVLVPSSSGSSLLLETADDWTCAPDVELYAESAIPEGESSMELGSLFSSPLSLYPTPQLLLSLTTEDYDDHLASGSPLSALILDLSSEDSPPRQHEMGSEPNKHLHSADPASTLPSPPPSPLYATTPLACDEHIKHALVPARPVSSCHDEANIPSASSHYALFEESPQQMSPTFLTAAGSNPLPPLSICIPKPSHSLPSGVNDLITPPATPIEPIGVANAPWQ